MGELYAWILQLIITPKYFLNISQLSHKNCKLHFKTNGYNYLSAKNTKKSCLSCNNCLSFSLPELENFMKTRQPVRFLTHSHLIFNTKHVGNGQDITVDK
jgi:hypothetical protein